MRGDDLKELKGRVTVRTYHALRIDLDSDYGFLLAFRKGEAMTVDELARVPDSTLLKVKNFGRVSLDDLRRVVRFRSEPGPSNDECTEAFRVASFGEGSTHGAPRTSEKHAGIGRDWSCSTVMRGGCRAPPTRD